MTTALANDYQYQYKDFLFGAGTDNVVRSVKGLLGRADISANDSDYQYDHGASPGLTTYRKRIITIDMAFTDTPGSNIETKIDTIQKAFQISRRRNFATLNEFIFRRNGVSKYLIARVDKLDLDSTFALTRGAGEVAIQLVAPDPIKYGVTLKSQQLVAAVNVAQVQGTFTNAGDLVDGARPTIEIVGPATNIRVTNSTDGNRAFRWDGAIATGSTLAVNFSKRTVTLDAADAYSGVRTDNQWWELLPGNNTIIYNRDAGNVGTSSTMTVIWRDTWA